jgi:NAD-dependent deacetylase
MNNIRTITQNIDGLHRKANHNPDNLIEIDGCINEKRRIAATERSEIINTGWDYVDSADLETSLLNLFNISIEGVVEKEESLRPHLLLFDEMYSELYQIEKAMKWMLESAIVIFMGASNSVEKKMLFYRFRLE